MSQLSPDARAVVRALDALTTQVRRLADAHQTPTAAFGDALPTTPRCACGDPIELRGDPPHWIHSPGSDTPCTDPRPDLGGPCEQHPHAPVIGGHCGGCTVYPADMRPAPTADDHTMTVFRQMEAEAAAIKAGLPPETPEQRRVRMAAALRREVEDARRAPAADEDQALRWARREPLLVLLTRVQRGRALTEDEARTLRHHVETEMHEADTARAVAAGNKRHVQVMYAELEQAQAAIKRVRAACAAIERDMHGAEDDGMRTAIVRVLAALDGTDQTTTEAP